ncbi:hypothetical protein A2U01_0003426 [Trifolium medium]|uniref:Uncharacterized protein n=1 Tax=Trifolium medium TaxID=97028 RepID=A0A392M5L1_9FABA|nr:hypothetical protein [Trifolium medium]
MVDPSRIIDSLYRAGLMARYAEQEGIWVSSWSSPEQDPSRTVDSLFRAEVLARYSEQEC